MKHSNPVCSVMSVVVSSLLLFATTGCQDTPVTSPAANADPSVLMKPKPQPKNDVIPLEATLSIPGRTFNSFASIKGQVVYSLTSTPYRGVYRVDLDLATSAVLVRGGDARTEWTVAGESHDQLFVSEEGIAVLEKGYTVKGSSGPLQLYLRFLLTSDGIELNAMWLDATNIRYPEDQTD